MTRPRFAFKAALPNLQAGAERPLIEQFRAIQNDLDASRSAGTTLRVTPVLSGDHTARVGELVLCQPRAAGMRITVPAGSAQNVGRTIRLALIGGILTPGVTVSIVGNIGTLNGASTLNLNSHRLVELVSCGPPGWFFST